MQPQEICEDTGTNTQHRVDCFVSQVAQRYYETVLFEIAKQLKDDIFAANYKSAGGERKREEKKLTG